MYFFCGAASAPGPNIWPSNDCLLDRHTFRLISGGPTFGWRVRLFKLSPVGLHILLTPSLQATPRYLESDFVLAYLLLVGAQRKFKWKAEFRTNPQALCQF